jgi:hypothetical protein
MPASRESHNKHVSPAIAVEIVHPVEKVVRVTFARLRHRRVEFLLLCEVRSGVPVRSVDDVFVAVVVQVANRDALGVIHVGQLLPGERVQQMLIIGNDAGGDDRKWSGKEQEHEASNHGGVQPKAWGTRQAFQGKHAGF